MSLSWIDQKAELDQDDRGLLTFSVAENQVFRIRKHEEDNDACLRLGEGHCIQQLQLRDEIEWDRWIKSGDSSITSPYLAGEDDDSTKQSTEVSSGINLIMGGKTSSLSKMPFSENTLLGLASKLKIHKSIVRAINRNTTCTFSRMMPALEGEDSCHRSIVYTCRTAETWENDMALSVTFFPDTLTTNAIWFGCNFEERDIHGRPSSDSAIITGKLRKFDGKVFHPMMLPTIFAESERERQVNLVRKSNSQFIQRMIDIESRNDVFYGFRQTHGDIRQSTDKRFPPHSSSPSGTGSFLNGIKGRLKNFLSGKTISTSSTLNSAVRLETLQTEMNKEDKKDEETCAMLWIEISYLKNGMESWKTQLHKMIDHVQELEDANFGMNHNISTEVWCKRRDELKECGKRIRERLRDLVDEYDHFIRECDHVTAGMSLATQMDLNLIGRRDARINETISRSNLAVAEMAQRDGSLMKSIATLGMIYLPATFVCVCHPEGFLDLALLTVDIQSFFSMGFFEWRGKSKSTTTVSPDLWIFGVAAIIFSLLTLAIFSFCTTSRRNKLKNKLHIV
ncbi:hypothetical protein CFAM422_010373 [Trichoderma lentiforme]|uniref:Uncharacterized protein n=1 Tax=Trichoderma lentiforme TaxID=1567552 RepID=A0A9P4X606_9HYPO|nr:hypothetical protein CFAM422_010373 [Trichoderma lentiforme]